MFDRTFERRMERLREKKRYKMLLPNQKALIDFSQENKGTDRKDFYQYWATSSTIR